MSDRPGTTVHFWFDPGCAFTWATTRWLMDVAARRGLHVSWHLMSLAILDEGGRGTEKNQAAKARSWRPIRVLAAVDDAHGASATGLLYAALGDRMHGLRLPLSDDLLTEALSAAGLPTDLVRTADDASWDEAIRASHQDGQERVGMDSGSPITAIETGTAFFGPVVAPVPTGQAALDLWDALQAASRVPQLSELKRGRGSLR